MKRKRSRMFFAAMSGIVFASVCCLFSGAGASTASAQEPAAFAGGAGSEDDPYLVATAQQLDHVRHHMDGHFRQTADLDLSDYAEDEGWEPIGYYRRWNDYDAFTGTYDGADFRIENLTIDRPRTGYVGLFGYLKDSAVVGNVVLENIEVHGQEYTGGLAGYNERGKITGGYAAGRVRGERRTGGLVGGSTGSITDSSAACVVEGGTETGGLAGNNAGDITNSHAEGTVTGTAGHTGGLVGVNAGTVAESHATGDVAGTDDTGGLIGSNHQTISNSYAAGDVRGQSRTGGLVGDNTRITARNGPSATITGSHATGSVEGESWVGGLCGSNRWGVIRNSYSTGHVTGRGDDVGGLVGFTHQWGNVHESYATGHVEGGSRVGGLVGGGETAVGSITASYATGNVTARGRGAGGLFGASRMRITDSYATGDVTAEEGDAGGLVGSGVEGITNSYAAGRVSGRRRLGGLIGHFGHGDITSSYYDKDAAGLDDGGAGTAGTTQEMMRKDTFEDWDFEDVWSIDEGESYPCLKWQDEQDG